jgi:hypothetical protein
MQKNSKLFWGLCVSYFLFAFFFDIIAHTTTTRPGECPIQCDAINKCCDVVVVPEIPLVHIIPGSGGSMLSHSIKPKLQLAVISKFMLIRGIGINR